MFRQAHNSLRTGVKGKTGATLVEVRDFIVAGSAPEPYRLTFMLDGTNLSGYCNCHQGQHGEYCRHRFGILLGESKGLVSDNVDQVAEVVSWLPGTDVGVALLELAAAVAEHEAAEQKLAAARERFAKALMD